MLLLVIGLGSLEYNSAPDKCEGIIYARDRAYKNVLDSKGNTKKDDISRAYFTQEHMGLEGDTDACIESQYFPFHNLKMFSSLNYSDYIPVLMIVVPLFFNMATPYLGKVIGYSFPSRLKEEIRSSNAASR